MAVGHDVCRPGEVMTGKYKTERVLHVGKTMLQFDNITLRKMERHLRNRNIVAGSCARPSPGRAPASWLTAPLRAPWVSAHGTSRALPFARSRWALWTLFISAKLPRPFYPALVSGRSAPNPASARSSVRLIRTFASRSQSSAAKVSRWGAKSTAPSTRVHPPRITKRISRPRSREIIIGPKSPWWCVNVRGCGRRLLKESHSSLSIGKHRGVQGGACS